VNGGGVGGKNPPDHREAPRYNDRDATVGTPGSGSGIEGGETVVAVMGRAVVVAGGGAVMVGAVVVGAVVVAAVVGAEELMAAAANGGGGSQARVWGGG
jgi:hypothetical protein